MSRRHYATMSDAIRREREVGGDEGTLLSVTRRLASAFQWKSLLGPEIALRDLEEIPGGIVEVAGAYAAVPRDLVDQRDASIGQALLPGVELAGRCEESRVDRSGGTVRRRLLLRRRPLSVEQQHDALPEPKREAPSPQPERHEAEHVLIEPLHLVLLIGCVVQNGLEHAGEPKICAHDAKVLVLTRETAANLERASTVSLFGSSATTRTGYARRWEHDGLRHLAC